MKKPNIQNYKYSNGDIKDLSEYNDALEVYIDYLENQTIIKLNCFYVDMVQTFHNHDDVRVKATHIFLSLSSSDKKKLVLENLIDIDANNRDKLKKKNFEILNNISYYAHPYLENRLKPL